VKKAKKAKEKMARTPPADLCDRPATEIARLVRARKLSPVAVLESCLARVVMRNGELNAIVTLNTRALDQARALEKRLKRKDYKPGILAGVVVGVKDVTPVAGLRCTYGSPIYRNHIATEDAVVVRRLREADAIIVGKTNTPEFAAGGNTFNEVFGRTRNPHDPSKSAGGSTGGGAAALASGMIHLAEGTDLGGSLRIPAAFCGVFGLRPSVGLVPTHPYDWAWDTIQVEGPMARTAEDAALMLQAIAGANEYSPLAQPTDGRDFVAAARKGMKKGMRVAYVADIAGLGIDPAVERVCRKAAFALRREGARVEEVRLDLSYARDAFMALRGEWFVHWHHSRLSQSDKFGANVANNVKSGLATTVEQLAAAEGVRGRVWQQFRKFFEDHDAIMTPCVAVPPFPVEQNFPDTIAGKPMKSYVDWIAPTYVLSMTGLPVSCVPCGKDESGMPVGVQVVGPQFGEEAVLRLSAAIEDATAPTSP
jgi:amidase